MTASRIPVVIDTDGGVDDAVAIWYLVTHPDVEVLAITVVHGNVPLHVAGGSVCKVLHAAGRGDIPVALGAESPMGPTPELRLATFIHGEDGLGDAGLPPAPFGPVDRSAASLLHALVDERPGAVELVTLGPLTNIGRQVREHAGWSEAVAGITVMGGAARGPGNARPFAEANIAHDPVAAAHVIGAPWGRPGTLVGLDVTNRATFTAAERSLIDERRNAAAAFLAGPIRHYARSGGTFSPPGEIPCHDLTAAMVTVQPDLVDAPVLPVEIDTSGGPAWGATIVDLRQPLFARAGAHATQQAGEGFPWRVALDIDLPRFRAEVGRLFGASELRRARSAR